MSPNLPLTRPLVGQAFWLVLLFLVAIAATGCKPAPQIPQERQAAAQALFDQTAKSFHVPSAAASGLDQRRLQDEAARGYEQLLAQYPEQSNLCAQALFNLGNLRAAQTNLEAAAQFYAAVERQYPAQDWEVLRALKSAADLLWEAGRKTAAEPFYRKIVARFDRPDVPPIVQSVVRGSKQRLAAPPSATP